MAGHFVRRAILLTIALCCMTYALITYHSTGHILARCIAGTTVSSSTKNAATMFIPKPPAGHQQSPVPTIGKVTMLYGDWATDEVNQAVLNTHRDHAEQQGYSLHVLDRQIMQGLWSKLSYMLMIVLEELSKPEDRRLKWLFWFDLDIVVTNPNIGLDIFLPPEDDFPHTNVLVTEDHNGLNSGSFFLRVNEWAVHYLADTIALHSYKPKLKLKFSDQSAQEVLTLNEKYANNTIYVPQRWFNAYRGPRNKHEKLIKGRPVPENTIQAGDVQLHFSGKKVKHLIPKYLDLVANNSMGWKLPLRETNLEAEVAAFYKLVKEQAMQVAQADTTAKKARQTEKQRLAKTESRR